MQITKEKLIAQQLVMFHLGFYRGVIDGIWASDSIQAKKDFESSDSFLPAYPNGGLPFGERDKLPAGMRYERGLITHESLTPEKAAEILKARSPSSNKETVVEVKPEVKEEPKPEIKEESKPEVKDVPVVEVKQEDKVLNQGQEKRDFKHGKR